MLPIIEREVVEKHKWSSREEIIDYFAISQIVPGIIAANTATIIGRKRHGVLGAFFATAGVISPSIIIITIIAALLNDFMEYPIVLSAFAGIRAAVAALIFAAVYKLIKSNVFGSSILQNILPALFFIAAFLFVILGGSPVFVVIGSALFGFLLYGRKYGE